MDSLDVDARGAVSADSAFEERGDIAGLNVAIGRWSTMAQPGVVGGTWWPLIAAKVSAMIDHVCE